MCKSQICIKKFIRLLLEVEFYSISIYLIFLFIGYSSFSIKQFLKAIFPFFDISTGFTSCYILFYLLIPYINKFIQSLTEKEHLKILSLILAIYTVLPSFMKVNITFNYITWFFVVYLLAAYLRLYHKKWQENKKIISSGLVISMLLSWISVGALATICNKMGKDIRTCYFFVNDSNKILAVSTAMFAFLFFQNMKLGCHKIINTIAASTFGVLQIHTSSDSMRVWLWNDLCNNKKAYISEFYFLHAIICIMLVFFICTLIDMIRIRWLEVPFFKIVDKNE